MSRNYDRWERLVEAVLRREQDRQLAAMPSMNSSYNSDDASDSLSNSSFDYRYSPPDLMSTSRGSSREHIDAIVDGGGSGRPVPGIGIHFFLPVESRELTISIGEDSNSERSIVFSSSSSNMGAVEINSVQGLDIRGRMKTWMMTPKVIYRAYLVYKFDGQFQGQAKAMVRFVDNETDVDAERRAELVQLHQIHNQDLVTWRPPHHVIGRADGWTKILLGEFHVGDKDDRVVEARLLVEKSEWKITGLIVEGIQFLPAKWVAMTEENEDTKSEENEDTKSEENEDREIDISLLQQFVPSSSSSAIRSTNLVTPSEHEWLSMKAQVMGLSRKVDDNAPHLNANPFCSDWNSMNNSSLQDERIDVKMMSNFPLPKDDHGLASLTRDEMFSRGYDCLTQAFRFLECMNKLVEQNEREIDDLKYKLHKVEIDSQFVLTAKDLELEKLRKAVDALKGDIDKCEQRSKEDERKAAKKMRELERKLEDAEAQAAVAVAVYKNSEELKIEKHKFASKAFAIGFELCKKQVLEIDPGFDIRRIDVKSNEPYSSSATS